MFIVRNISGGTISIDDLGLTLAAAEEYNLGINDQPHEVANSQDLINRINAGEAVILDPLDGVTALNTLDSITCVQNANDPNFRSFGTDLTQISGTDDLQAIEALTGTGILTRTGANTWAERTVTGTTDQVDVSNGDGVAGNPILTLAANTSIPGTEGINIPSGTTAQRPGTPAVGDMRFNTTNGSYEAWDGTEWVTFGASAGSSIKEILFGQLPHAQGTTTIPYDNTPPLITEGTEFFSQAVTTVSASGRIIIWFSSIVSISNANRIATISIFRDSTLVGVTAVSMPSSNDPQTSTFIVVDDPGPAGTYTYSGRIGVSASATWRIGGFTVDANYGGPANTNNQYVVARVE